MAETLSLQERYAPDSRCFGCGPANPEGLRIESFPSAGRPDPEGDGLVCDWRPRKCHEAFDGCLNGGIVGALLDCHGNWTAGWHLMQRDGRDRPTLTVTAEYRVRLRRPTPTDGTVRLTARAVGSDGPWVEIEATLTAGGEVTATFNGRFVAVGRNHPAVRHGLGAWDPSPE